MGSITFAQAFEGRYGYDKPYNHMNADLKERVSVVTGSAGMIGGAIAELLAACGSKVAIVDINAEAGDAEVKRIKDAGGEAKFFGVDLFSRGSIDKLVEDIIGEYGRIDNLICNAGINASNRKPITGFTDEFIMKNINCNLTGSVVYLCRQVVPYMIKQGGGNIVNTTSVCGVTGLRKQCAFVASKFGVSGITRSMALEYAKYNIRVNALAPGSLPLPYAEMRGGQWSAASNWDNVDLVDYDKNFENPQSMLFDIPARRPAFPSEMAGLVCYLVSDDASYTTGQVICVDGGWTAGYSGNY